MKNLLVIISISLLLWIGFSIKSTILDFFKNPAQFFEDIFFKDVFIAVGAIITIGLTIWRSHISAETLKNQNKIRENEEKTKKNQQFLDSLKLFETNNLDIKRGALYNLENLALSSPEYRQRILDFLNSLNTWVRNADYKYFEETKIKELREKNIPLISSATENLPSPLDQQLLSAETSRIFEQIIKKQNIDWELFTEEEKNRYSLNFTNVIFFNLNLSHEIFPYSIDFSESILLGKSTFEGCEFKQGLKFVSSEFTGSANFIDSTFQGDTEFTQSKFNNSIEFNGALFEKRLNFFACQLKSGIYFTNSEKQSRVTFKDSVSFEKCNNQKEISSFINFDNAYFASDISFERSKFSELSLQNTTVIGRANFYKIESKNIYLSHAEFKNSVDLRNGLHQMNLYAIETSFVNSIDFRDLKIINSNFSNANFCNPDFTRLSFEGETNFERVDFSNIKTHKTLENTTYEKIKLAGGIFSDEQKNFFENKS